MAHRSRFAVWHVSPKRQRFRIASLIPSRHCGIDHLGAIVGRIVASSSGNDISEGLLEAADEMVIRLLGVVPINPEMSATACSVDYPRLGTHRLRNIEGKLTGGGLRRKIREKLGRCQTRERNKAVIVRATSDSKSKTMATVELSWPAC